MSWYYASGGKQEGPVTDDAFDALVANGTITPLTLVWRQGMAEWKPYREVRPAAPPPPTMPGSAAPDSGQAPSAAATASVPGNVTCAECGLSFAPDQVIRLNDRWICAHCKPVHLQRMMEGSAPSGAASAGTVPLEEVREREYEHDVGGYLSRAWELLKSDMGNFIGATVLVYLCLFAGNFVPYLGAIIALVITGPLMGGLWMFLLAKVRGQEVKPSDAFKGFGPRFVPLMLVHVVSSILAGLCLAPAGAVAVPAIIIGSNSSGNDAAMIPFLIAGGVVAIIGLCAMYYFIVCWFYSIQLVADKGMNFWPAMGLSRAVVRKHWWQNFLVMFVAGLIAGMGMLLCGVGLLITGPLAAIMVALAYERLFGDMQAKQG